MIYIRSIYKLPSHYLMKKSPTSWRGILVLISSKYFNPILCAFVSVDSAFRSSNVRQPFSYSFKAVAGPIPHTSPNKLIVRTCKITSEPIFYLEYWKYNMLLLSNIIVNCILQSVWFIRNFLVEENNKKREIKISERGKKAQENVFINNLV